MNAKSKKVVQADNDCTDLPRSPKPCMRMPYDRLRVQSKQGGESTTVQDPQNTTDVNEIVKKYHRTGMMPPGKQGIYADVTGLQGDLTERLIWAKQVQEDAQREIAEIQQQQAAATDQTGNTTNETTVPDQTENPNAQSTTPRQSEGQAN